MVNFSRSARRDSKVFNSFGDSSTLPVSDRVAVTSGSRSVRVRLFIEQSFLLSYERFMIRCG